MLSKVLRTDVVPAPEEPVTAMMGCLRDMMGRVEGHDFRIARLPGDGTTKTAFGDKAPKAGKRGDYCREAIGSSRGLPCFRRAPSALASCSLEKPASRRR